ncbi:putative ankyrin repeat-containing domain, PGG domain, ankyrin repeat-containing domain superfamily [Helianthus debilis subsp. tardiflorus]
MNNPSRSSGHQQQQQQNHTIIQMPQQPVPSTMPPQQNRPILDLISGNRKDYCEIGVPLYEAAMKGDWKAAKSILDTQPSLIRYAITENEETLLHVAASAEITKAVEFVKNLVTLMENADLELQNKNWDTALSFAAQVGNIDTAMVLVKKNPTLTEIPNRNKAIPLYTAISFAQADMARYLYGISNRMSGDFWSHENRGGVLQKCVEADMFDVAINIVNDHPKLTENKRLLMDVLLALAEKPYAFKGRKPSVVFRIIKSFFEVFHLNLGPHENENVAALRLLKIIWEKIAQMPKSDTDDILRGPKEMDKSGKTGFPSRVLFVATKMGNTRFIIEFIRLYPDVIWKQDDKGRTIFHLAIKFRQENIYNLLHEIGAMKGLITPMKDNKGNNMLHMVAKSVKHAQVQVAALQLQRELLWFKEVENMIPLQYRSRKNRDGFTPRDLFTKKHENLVAKGEDWMKDTISQCLVAATLVTTITFAANFTLPGGYNQVGRYTEYDFLESLQKKLICGLAGLFLSIVTMMVAFCASFFVLYSKQLEWMPIYITYLVGMPLILTVTIQLRLIGDFFNSTYRSRYIFKPKKRVLYY